MRHQACAVVSQSMQNTMMETMNVKPYSITTFMTKEPSIWPLPHLPVRSGRSL